MLSWPAVSPDLSPIEYVWDTMDRQLRRLPGQPRNVDQLGRRLQEIWEQLPQDSGAPSVFDETTMYCRGQRKWWPYNLLTSQSYIIDSNRFTIFLVIIFAGHGKLKEFYKNFIILILII